MRLVSYGDDSKRDTPVPMPNTEVKPLNADGTWLVTTWESRKLPVTKRTHADHETACVFLCVYFVRFVGRLRDKDYESLTI